jgi:hypothetical protein
MTKITKTNQEPIPQFSLGRVCFTESVRTSIVWADAFDAIKRHSQGDWGDLDEGDKLSNAIALEQGGRLLSSYTDRNGTKFWIITEHHRNQTTVLLPADY